MVHRGKAVMCPWLWQTMAHPMAIPLLVGVGASSRLPSAAGRERTQLLNKRRFQMTRDSKRPKIGVGGAEKRFQHEQH